MKKTKKKILDKARALFNENGVANVSIRMISRGLAISHSNLIYHFKDKNALINQLHQEILDQAIVINQQLSTEKNTFKSLIESIDEGFKVIYEYRFFMIDLNLIMRENKALHQEFLAIEKLRFRMYEEKILQLIEEKVLRAEKYEGEYANLITQIRILSDYWVASSQIYDAGEKESTIISKYAKLLRSMFYPYLTEAMVLLLREKLSTD